MIKISSLQKNLNSLLQQLNGTQVVPQTSIRLEDIYNEYIDESVPNSISGKHYKNRSKRPIPIRSSSNSLKKSNSFLTQKQRLESGENDQENLPKLDIKPFSVGSKVSFAQTSAVIENEYKRMEFKENMDARKRITRAPPPSNNAKSELKQKLPPPNARTRKKRKEFRAQTEETIRLNKPVPEMIEDMDTPMMNRSIGRYDQGNTHALQYSPSMIEFRNNLNSNLNSAINKRLKPMVALRINKHTLVPSVPVKCVDSVSIAVVEKSHEKTNTRSLPPTPVLEKSSKDCQF